MTASSTRTAHQGRLLQQKVTKKQNRPQGNYLHSEFQWGEIQGIDPGPPPTVSVFIDASPTATPNVKYLASYVPTVGDVVLIQRGKSRVRSSRVVLHKLNGSATPYPTPLGGLIVPPSDSTEFDGVTPPSMHVQQVNNLWGSVELPPGNLGAAGDWCMGQNGHLYFNNAGTWEEKL
jgi:hypothetical protein